MRLVVAFALLTAVLPRHLHAQADTTFYSETAPRWVGHFTVASSNVLLGAITAGITQELKGGSFRDGFMRGALGGAAVYAGKVIAAERFYGAGLLGRQVAATGSSIIRNAGDGVGSFDRIVLPVGVARIYWDRGATKNISAKIDGLALGWTIYGIVEPELDFDAGKSLSFGAPTFHTKGSIIDFGDNPAGGVVKTGVVFLSDVRPWGQDFLKQVQAHERIHVLQMDRIFLTLNDPYDDRLLRALPAGSVLNRWIDINLSTEFIQLLGRFIDEHGDRPWEMEANYLSR